MASEELLGPVPTNGFLLGHAEKFEAQEFVNTVTFAPDICEHRIRPLILVRRIRSSMCGAILEPVDRILEPFDNRVSYLFLNCSQVKKFRISLFFILSKDIGKTFHQYRNENNPGILRDWDKHLHLFKTCQTVSNR